MYTIQHSPKAVRYMQQVFQWAHQSRRRKRHLDHFSHFLQGSQGDRPTDWLTDRPHYSVGNNRQSAQWRSQILLLSMATTSIYCSSRLDRSDQLQQSAAIFSYETRWVAVLYIETHSLEGSVSHRHARQLTQLHETTVYLFTETQAV